MLRAGLLILVLARVPAAGAETTLPRDGDWHTHAGAGGSLFMIEDAHSATGLIARSGRGTIAAARAIVPLDLIGLEACGGAGAAPEFQGPGAAWALTDRSGNWMHGLTVRLDADAPITVIEAYSSTGILIGRVVGGPSSVLRLDFPGSIGRVVVRALHGCAAPAAEPAACCPAPGAHAALVVGLVTAAHRRRGRAH